MFPRIHMLPVMPMSALTRTQKFVKEEWTAFFAEGAVDPASSVAGGWKGILYANLALIDPVSAWKFFAASDFDSNYLDGGASRTWYLAYAAGMFTIVAIVLFYADTNSNTKASAVHECTQTQALLAVQHLHTHTRSRSIISLFAISIPGNTCIGKKLFCIDSVNTRLLARHLYFSTLILSVHSLGIVFKSTVDLIFGLDYIKYYYFRVPLFQPHTYLLRQRAMETITQRLMNFGGYAYC